MILCAIDDLLFSIKISTAAKGLGADVYFERAPAQLLSTIRGKRPGLVIFDLNSTRMRPLETVRAMKADPELLEIRTLGYVSHVDAATIAAARDAGVDRIIARSAFVDGLGAILRSA